MSKIMTAEEWLNDELTIVNGIKPNETLPLRGSTIHIIMDAYFQYRAKALIEGLTNEMIKNQFYHTFERIGAHWARQELLNRLKQDQ